MKITKPFLIAAESKKAKDAYDELNKKYKFAKNISDADAIIVLGGDGFMLHTLHNYMETNLPIYGMNCGSVGFLMNEYRSDNIFENLNDASLYQLNPLIMEAIDENNNKHTALAINEVALLRQTKQASHLRINIDGKVRLNELICDGILVATPAGSTAYNLSVHGPILPLKSNLLALTPISPFRPRRWRGALLDYNVDIKIDILNYQKRPVSSTADSTEIRNVTSVNIKRSNKHIINILFDKGHSLEERIIKEQFLG